MTPIETLSRFAAGLTYAAIPADVRATAVRALVDTVGVAIGGDSRAVTGRMRALAEARYAPGRASVFGSTARLCPQGAAFVNGTAAHALDFDDNCYAGFVHGSAVIVPAALAVAQEARRTGRDLLTAFVAGSEVEFAIGAAATAHIYEKGWWTTGVLGPMGASVAAAKLMGADAAVIAHALGLAVAQAGGAKACFGTDGKPALCGRAAETGVAMAELALAGMTGPADAFENSRGFTRLLNDGIWDGGAVEAIGRDWLMRAPGIDIKRIPVCLSAHAAVDALMDIVAEHGLDRSAVSRVVCDVGPVVRANLVYDRPVSPQQAQFSLPFCIGAALVQGDLSLASLAPEVLASREVRAAMDRVEVVTGPRWDNLDFARAAPEGAIVTLVMADGRRLERFNAMARGTTARPLSDAEFDAKFLSCVAGPLRAKGAVLLDRLRGIEAQDNLLDLIP
jgi:2-methylcitrate dehydratase PrpD